MKFKKIQNKRASIGSTLTWIAATFVIIFILAIYFVFLSVIYAKKTIGGDIADDVVIKYSDNSKLDMTKKFLSNLEKIETVDSKEYAIKDIILMLAKTFDSKNSNFEQKKLVYSIQDDPFLKLDDNSKALMGLVLTDLVGGKPFYECGKNLICYPELTVKTDKKTYIEYTPGISLSKQKIPTAEFATYSVKIPYNGEFMEISVSKSYIEQARHDTYYSVQYQQAYGAASSGAGSSDYVKIFGRK